MSNLIITETPYETTEWITADNINISRNYYSTVIYNGIDYGLSSAENKSYNEWGPKRDPLYIVIPVTVIYAVIFLTGVVGNVSTCIVIAKNKSMHTATNYYLFSLAVSDLLLLVSGLPPEMYQIWSRFPYIFGEVFCILQGFAAETSANATVLTITAFTIERYVAICHPFLSHTMSKLSRAIKFVMAIWLLAMCLAVPQAMSFGIVYATTEYDDHYVCSVKRIVIPHAFEISTFLFFVAPMSLITVLYVLIGLQLRRTALRGGAPTRGAPHSSSVRLKHRQGTRAIPCRTDASTNLAHTVVIVTPGEEADIEERVEMCREEDGRKNFPRNAQHNATRHVVKMLVAVVVAFFVCWAPFHAQRLLAVYGDQEHSAAMVAAFRILTYVSGVLYYLSTTINPLLYHIMSHKFREAFKDTFIQCRNCCKSHEKEGKCYSTLSGRSSQVNSHSGNTDSACSRQSSLRYLEPDLVARRPLIVSFRRPGSLNQQYINNASKSRVSNGRLKYGPSCLSINPDIQQSLNNLEELSGEKKRYLNEKLKVITLMDTEMPSINMDLCSYRNDRSPNGSIDLNIPFTNGRCFPSCDYSINESPNSRIKHNGFTMDPEILAQANGNLMGKKCKTMNYDSKDIHNLFNESPTLTGINTKDVITKKYVNFNTEPDTEKIFLNSSVHEIYDSSAVEMQNLQPTHICPHKKYNNYPRIEDIEIFHKQTFKINKRYEARTKRHHHHHHRHKPSDNSVATTLHKSCTLSSFDQSKKVDQVNGNEQDKILHSGSPIRAGDRSNSCSCLRIDDASTDSSSAVILIK